MYSKGICWIDDCRIPHNEEIQIAIGYQDKKQSEGWGINDRIKELSNRGRFPANILVSDDMLNDGVISKSNDNIRNNTLEQKIYGGGNGLPPQASKGFNDKGSNSRYYDIDKWFEKLLDNE